MEYLKHVHQCYRIGIWWSAFFAFLDTNRLHDTLDKLGIQHRERLSMVIAMDEVQLDKLGGMLYQLVPCKHSG